MKSEFFDPEIATTDKKNAIETLFLAASSPQKDIWGMPAGFWEKSIFGSIGSLKRAEIAFFVLGLL